MAPPLLTAYALPALVTLLAAGLYLSTPFLVGVARGRHKVRPPATSGPPEFERVLRVQQNTLEQLAFFLPVFWLAVLFGNAQLASALGFVWVGARIGFAVGYTRSVEQRAPGFAIGLFACVVLFGVALTGVISHLL